MTLNYWLKIYKKTNTSDRNATALLGEASFVQMKDWDWFCYDGLHVYVFKMFDKNERAILKLHVYVLT